MESAASNRPGAARHSSSKKGKFHNRYRIAIVTDAETRFMLRAEPEKGGETRGLEGLEKAAKTERDAPQMGAL